MPPPPSQTVTKSLTWMSVNESSIPSFMLAPGLERSSSCLSVIEGEGLVSLVPVIGRFDNNLSGVFLIEQVKCIFLEAIDISLLHPDVLQYGGQLNNIKGVLVEGRDRYSISHFITRGLLGSAIVIDILSIQYKNM